MDGGPFRAGRPVERRVASRPEPVRRAEEQPVSEPQKPAAVHHRAPASQHVEKEAKSWKRFILPVIITIILLGAAGWFAFSNMRGGGIAIDGSKYQAVFFTNGQVYFGKLKSVDDEYLKLTDIYYLQTKSGEKSDSENPQQTSSDQGDVQLIKLGDEIHGPEDEMTIVKDQVLFYENLKADGKVAQSIEKHKSSK